MRRIEKRELNNISNDSSCARVFRAHFDGGFSPMPRQVVTSFFPHSHARTGTHCTRTYARDLTPLKLSAAVNSRVPLLLMSHSPRMREHCSFVPLCFETFRCMIYT